MKNSRISLPIHGNNETDISVEDTSAMLSKIDITPGQLFKPKKTIIERHKELISELKGKKDKPSILGNHKPVSHLSPNPERDLNFKPGNFTDRKHQIRRSLHDPFLQSSTKLSESGSSKNILNFDMDQKSDENLGSIFQKQFNFPSTVKQKELFAKKKHNQSLPKLMRVNKDISDVT